MIEPRLQTRVTTGAGEVAVWRWQTGRPAGPPALLVHGTGFVSQVWQAVAESLARERVVYAIDRRGHGLSAKPEDAYHFLDFAEDVCAVVDELGLRSALGVGHSAGATDLLLASVLRPAAFARVFAMEPTVMDVAEPPSPPSGRLEEIMEGTRRRRVEFESEEQVLERYASRPAFAAWRPDLLARYVRHGFEEREGGRVRLRCTPPIEMAMLVHIDAAMGSRYAGDRRGNPFASLPTIACPVCISTTERSADIYKTMAARARRLIPGATAVHFEGAGHAVAQEDPASVVREIRRFAA